MLLRTSFAKVLVGLALLATTGLQANNIQVANVSFTDNGGTAQVLFDLSWENSWRGVGVTNWDAAWVFVKYRNSAGVWAHAYLNTTGHVVPGTMTLDLAAVAPQVAHNASANPYVGAFLYRATDGVGNIALTGLELQWDYNAAGLAFTDIAQVQVFAIEMVYVEQGEFAAGGVADGGTPFILTTINTPNASLPPAGVGSLGGQAGGRPTGQAPVNSAFPNGFNAFYCMKYEISQRARVDHLNTLTYDQQVTRTGIPPAATAQQLVFSGTARMGIRIATPGVASTTPAVYGCDLDNDGIFNETESDGTDIPTSYLSVDDYKAYLDWSGLRPMTELEFEKACRGPLPSVPNEFAWGTAERADQVYTYADLGGNAETVSANYSLTRGNTLWAATRGPLGGPARQGIFAGSLGNSGRVTSGATYFGIMEMSGNLLELTVAFNTGGAGGYSGAHGDGTLTGPGLSNVPNWTIACGLRGGAWIETWSQISWRNYNPNFNGRAPTVGGRGVRSAP